MSLSSRGIYLRREAEIREIFSKPFKKSIFHRYFYQEISKFLQKCQNFPHFWSNSARICIQVSSFPCLMEIIGPMLITLNSPTNYDLFPFAHFPLADIGISDIGHRSVAQGRGSKDNVPLLLRNRRNCSRNLMSSSRDIYFRRGGRSPRNNQ